MMALHTLRRSLQQLGHLAGRAASREVCLRAPASLWPKMHSQQAAGVSVLPLQHKLLIHQAPYRL